MGRAVGKTENKPYLPLPSRPKLVLIYRPRRDGRLSWPERIIFDFDLVNYIICYEFTLTVNVLLFAIAVYIVCLSVLIYAIILHYVILLRAF